MTNSVKTNFVKELTATSEFQYFHVTNYMQVCTTHIQRLLHKVMQLLLALCAIDLLNLVERTNFGMGAFGHELLCFCLNLCNPFL